MNELVIDFNILTIIDILSIATAFMLGLLFITAKSSNKKANLFLGMFLWSLTVEVLITFFANYHNNPIFIPIQTSILTIVLLYYYVLFTLRYNFKPKYLLLIIPFVLVNTFAIPEEITEILEYVFNISLLFVILKHIKKHRNKLTNFYSDIENKTLAWIKTIVFIYLLFHALWIVEDIINITSEDLALYFAFTSTILTFFMVYWIGYNGFSQSEIFTSELFLTNYKITENNDEHTKETFLQLIKIIEEKRLYTNTKLDIKTLAKQLNVKERELSKMINLHTKKNFYHFINHFRVTAFKKLLLSPKAKQLSLLGLAQEAGFPSKSTFYAVFKTEEGITPKQYQNKIKSSE